MDLSSELKAELSKAWAAAAATGGHVGEPHADALARAEVLYSVTRLFYDETKFGRPPGAPGELKSIGLVADEAMAHTARALEVVRGGATTLDPRPS